MERLFTIGAYGFDAARFFDALQESTIDLFLDLRRRRGVRGSQYSFANAARLQAELEARAIAYRHVLELAPEQATRDLQSQADKASHQPRRSRSTLSDAFVLDYVHRTLEPFGWEAFIQSLEPYRRPILFCVEGNPLACHRHLVAERLAALTKMPVEDLVP
jgi:uncharacterized protein (DUF488 family)